MNDRISKINCTYESFNVDKVVKYETFSNISICNCFINHEHFIDTNKELHKGGSPGREPPINKKRSKSQISIFNVGMSGRKGIIRLD